MSDFTMSITHTFAPNTIIASAQMNTNLLNDIRDKFNAMIHGTNGHTHSGATGDGPKINASGIDLTADYAWTGIHSWVAAKARIGGAGAGKGYLQYDNTANNRTLTIPDPGADASFVMTEGTQTVNSALTFTNTILANSIVAIDLVTNGNRIDLDADNDTSIRCSADDTIKIEVGGVDLFTLSSTGLNLVLTNQKIIFDTDSDTSIRASSDDVLTFQLGGSDHVVMNASGEMQLADVDPPTADYFNRNSAIAARARYDDNTFIFTPRYNCANVLDDDGDGLYQITFDTSVDSGNVNAVASCATSSAVFFNVTNISTSQITIQGYDLSGTGTDADFQFIVAGIV